MSHLNQKLLLNPILKDGYDKLPVTGSWDQPRCLFIVRHLCPNLIKDIDLKYPIDSSDQILVFLSLNTREIFDY